MHKNLSFLWKGRDFTKHTQNSTPSEISTSNLPSSLAADVEASDINFGFTVCTAGISFSNWSASQSGNVPRTTKIEYPAKQKEINVEPGAERASLHVDILLSWRSMLISKPTLLLQLREEQWQVGIRYEFWSREKWIQIEPLMSQFSHRKPVVFEIADVRGLIPEETRRQQFCGQSEWKTEAQNSRLKTYTGFSRAAVATGLLLLKGVSSRLHTLSACWRTWIEKYPLSSKFEDGCCECAKRKAQAVGRKLSDGKNNNGDARNADFLNGFPAASLTSTNLRNSSVSPPSAIVAFSCSSSCLAMSAKSTGVK